MPTNNQTRAAMLGAAMLADKRWQAIVDELNERIAELEQENSRLTQALAGDIQ